MGRRLLYAALVAALAGCGGGGGSDRSAPGADAGIGDLPDEDGDSIADEHEGRASGTDTDGDGVPDYLDPDSDDDGIPDYREAGDDRTGTPPVDSDGDGTPDFRDTDSDDNGRADGVDGTEDLDGDGKGNFADLDDDGDGIRDVDEIGPSAMMPLDSDGDGLFDFQDIDSDNDTIKDLHEGVVDTDGDGVPAYLDDDSDGDCIPDAAEAGDADVDTPPVDSDADGKFDFLDFDSDNDGLVDQAEDVNCNGSADGGESSATNPDSDGDGISDLVETAAGTDPNDPGDNPAANGDFVFEVPYMKPPNPPDDTLDFATDVSQADVVFAMDTTGSMGGEINNLKASVSSLVTQIRAQVPNIAFGVVEYRDFPTGGYGVAGDFPFKLRHRVMTVNTGAGLSSIQSAVNGYSLGNGDDTPESGWEALYQTASGAGIVAGGANVPPFNPATAPPATPPAGESVGAIGGAGFRTGSLPIVVWMTDACSHNSDIGQANNYSFSGPARSTTAINALLAIGARVISVVSSGDICTRDQQALGVTTATGAVVPPSAWGPAGSRPAGCSVGQCCTGQNGAGQAPDGTGNCPLVFHIDANGNGLGTATADAVEVLTGFATLDIGADAQDDPSDAVDAVAEFIDRIEANPSAPAPCASGLTAIDVNPADGVNDTFDEVTPGTTVCFDVVPKMNTTVPALTTPQMFKATVVVSGDGVTTLDTRDVYFLVPPEIPDEPIE